MLLDNVSLLWMDKIENISGLSGHTVALSHTLFLITKLSHSLHRCWGLRIKKKIVETQIYKDKLLMKVIIGHNDSESRFDHQRVLTTYLIRYKTDVVNF